MVIYREMMSQQASEGLANLAAALFLLPYFLFSTIAGELTDKYDRTSCARMCKLIEIPLMCIAVIGFLIPSVPLLLTVLFLMGAQSTFFGPAKYALIPSLMKKEEIMTGNGWITGGTYLAILLGVVGGSLSMGFSGGGILCSGILTIISKNLPPGPVYHLPDSFSGSTCQSLIPLAMIISADVKKFVVIMVIPPDILVLRIDVLPG